jgi:predicted enzyme related to lactoylglutathione lyase
MKILKTYARWLTDDVDAVLASLRELLGHAEDYRFALTPTVEIAGIGGFCLVAGDRNALAPYAGTVGPIVVDDLHGARDAILAAGMTVSRDETDCPTGRLFYARGADGTEIEYLQWDAATSARVLGTGADHD